MRVLTLLGGSVARRGMKLRPYQQQMIANIKQSWSLGLRNIGAVLPTGSGKTVIFSAVASESTSPVAAIAHRTELVCQMSLTFAKYGIRHRIIGPDKTIRMINQLQIEELGTSFYHPAATTAVVGANTLVARADRLKDWAASVGLWITDECFVAGTLIDGRPIETLRVGNVVTAFNEKTGRLEPRKITRLFKKPAPEELVRVESMGGDVIWCTKNHPFYTQRGWVNAEEITRRDTLYLVREANYRNDRGTTVQLAKNRSHLLSKKMRVCLSKLCTTGTEESSRVNRSLLRMWKRRALNRSSKTYVPYYRQGVLQPGVLRRLPVKTIIGNYGANKPKVCKSTYERTQTLCAIQKLDNEFQTH